jgi:hypothetical protein
MNSSEVIILKLCFTIPFFICFIVYFINFLDEYKVYEERATKYEKWQNKYNLFKQLHLVESEKQFLDLFNQSYIAPPTSSPIPNLIIALILGSVFAYALEILKIYLIIVLPLMWLAAKIKR